MTLASEITQHLKARGADLVGFADLSELPAATRHDLPRAVAFAVALSPSIAAGIQNGPTVEYHTEYQKHNALLGEMSESTADFLRGRGFAAVSSAATDGDIDLTTLSTQFPHKTAGVLAGLGWIGKCDLLVSESFGSAIRINRVLTDAPLPVGVPVDQSRCGNCRNCVDACPAAAIAGESWVPGKHRDELIDAFTCRGTARELAMQRTGISATFCGICIAVCPWTQAYIKRHQSSQSPIPNH